MERTADNHDGVVHATQATQAVPECRAIGIRMEYLHRAVSFHPFNCSNAPRTTHS